MSSISKSMSSLAIVLLILGIIIGGISGYIVGYQPAKQVREENENLKSQIEQNNQQISELENQLDALKEKNNELENQLSSTWGTEKETKVLVEQEGGGLVYWVLPGPRKLDPSVFGTPDNPMFGNERLGWAIKEASKLPSPLNNSVVELIKKLPFLVAVPEEMRQKGEDGQLYLMVPNLFSDKARIIDGKMSIEYIDRIPYDIPGNPTDTLDEVKANIEFSDPSGNQYRIVVKKVIMSTIPGYETGGGVIINAWHHGTTGTGSPLMPMVYTYGAFWAVGDLYINGSLAEENVLVHAMTTEVVRDKDYKLAVTGQLPLSLDNTPAGQAHHTHIVVMPIQLTPEGPVFHPLKTAFVLPNGKPQPFIHVMFEQDKIVYGPFKDWGLSSKASASNPGETGSSKVGTDNNTVAINLEVAEWSFNPPKIIVEKGQQVTIVLVNKGKAPHNIFIEGYNVTTKTISPGETDTITFTANVDGQFLFWCTVPGHREAGLEGKLVVQG